MSNSKYTATYAFNGYLRGEYAEPVSLISETVDRMREEGVDIAFLGATQKINGAGQLIELTARYDAPSQGTVGRLNCRACLPACGSPQRVGETDAASERGRTLLTGR